MNLMDWLFIPLFLLTLVTLLLLVILGATVVYPWNWGVALGEAAVGEIYRRFFGLGLRSQGDLIAAGRMLGGESKPANIEDNTTSTILDAVLVLTNGPSRSYLEAELGVLRSRLQSSAIDQQVQIVAGVRSIHVASYLWVASVWLNKARFTLTGFLWLFLRALPFLKRRLQKHNATLAIIGIVAGLLWAGIQRTTMPEGSRFDWPGVIGSVSIICAISGMVIAVLALYKAVLVTMFGAPRRWTPRGLVAGGVILLYICGVLGLSWFGVLADWQRHLFGWAESVHMADGVNRWVGGLALFLAIGYGLRNAYRWLRAPGMTLSSRLWILTVSPFLLVIFVLLVPFVLDIPYANVSWILNVGWLSVLFGTIAVIVGCVEWVQKYRMVKHLGLLIPRKAFRWWALLTWIGAGLVFNSALLLLLSTNHHPEHSSLYSAGLSILSVLIGVWKLTFLPGVLIAALYARRIGKVYETMRFQLAPPHPNSAQTHAPIS